MNEQSFDVSIVVPAYHAENTIGRAIESIFAQPGIRPEVIVVVDGSPDRTASEAKSFDGVKVLLNEKNVGAPASRNRGLTIAKADFVMFLDADDYIEGPLLHSLQDAMLIDDADFALGPSALEWPDGSRNHKSLPCCDDEISLIVDWYNGNYVPPCAVLWRQSFLRRLGGWDESLRKNQDGDLVFRAILSGGRITFSRSGLGVYSQHASRYRISAQTSQESIESRGIVLNRILESVHNGHTSSNAFQKSRLSILNKMIAKEYYSCAIDAFDANLVGLAEKYLEKARSLGFRGHTGPPMKRLLSTLIGVRYFRLIRKMVKESAFNSTHRSDI